MSYYNYGPYVSVAERRAIAAKHVEKEKKKGKNFNPIVASRVIAKTFWGKAWCDNLEAYSDYSNRLPRGRTYVRNGSIIDFKVTKGSIEGLVMGSSLYKVSITIKAMEKAKWKELKTSCAGKIDSLIELLQGKFSKNVMEELTKKQTGLFPKSTELQMKCSCPDGARMCKHVAAILYAMGASLDLNPEGLFNLRHVDYLDLINSVDQNMALLHSQGSQNLIGEDLSALFGIEIDSGELGERPTKPGVEKSAKPKKSTKIDVNAVNAVNAKTKAKAKKVVAEEENEEQVTSKKPIKTKSLSQKAPVAMIDSSTKPKKQIKTAVSSSSADEEKKLKTIKRRIMKSTS